MATGPREVSKPLGVRTAMYNYLETFKYQGFYGEPSILVLAGGASGCDQLWAEACVQARVPFQLYVPNEIYEHKYYRTEDWCKFKDSMYFGGIKYIAEHPKGTTYWRTWKDNHSRNQALVDTADTYVVCSLYNPGKGIEWVNRTGGTADCIRRLHKAGVIRVWWIPTDEPEKARFVSLKDC